MTPQTGDTHPHALTHYMHMCMCMQTLGSGAEVPIHQIMYEYPAVRTLPKLPLPLRPETRPTS